MKKRLIRLAVLWGLMALLFTACATQPHSSSGDVPGFWLGIFHGATLPFALVSELFTNNRIYAFPNSGALYDVGFFIGAALIFECSGTAARRPSSSAAEDED